MDSATLNPQAQERALFNEERIRRYVQNAYNSLTKNSLADYLLNDPTALQDPSTNMALGGIPFMVGALKNVGQNAGKIDDLAREVVGVTGLVNKSVPLTDDFDTAVDIVRGVGGKNRASLDDTMKAIDTIKAEMAQQMTPGELAKNKSIEKAIDLIQPRIKAETEGIDPLIQEARKYKSAEEFVKANTPIYHGTPKKFDKFDTSISEGNATWFTADKKDILENTAGAVQPAGAKLNIMERYVKPNLKLATPEQANLMFTDQLIAEGYRGVKYPKGEYGDYEWTKLFYPNEDTITKSQLTDIYTKAKGVKK